MSGSRARPARDGTHRHRRRQRTILSVIALAGAAGAVARDGLTRLFPAGAHHFDWVTFWINVSGSLLIGVVLVLLTERFPPGQLARAVIVTGFLGAFTTFSTYAVDTDLLLRARDLSTAAADALGSVTAGGAAVAFGMLATRAVIRFERRPPRPIGPPATGS